MTTSTPSAAIKPAPLRLRFERVPEQARWLRWLSPLFLVIVALIVGGLNV